MAQHWSDQKISHIAALHLSTFSACYSIRMQHFLKWALNELLQLCVCVLVCVLASLCESSVVLDL